ncbi:MAG: exodeoxyribonuclease VII small subunit [Cognaticolwellia sp.]|jgi:exodeoxyribonuclease VII small subunit
MSDKEPTFEILLEQLEKRVEQLEKGELPLEQALKLFEEGIELTRSCHERLDQADERIAVLTRGAGGQDLEEPLS